METTLIKRSSAHDPAVMLRKLIFVTIVTMLLTAALVVVARAAPEAPTLFSYLSPGCKYYYDYNGTHYMIEHRGMSKLNGFDTISYRVYWWNGFAYDFLTAGLLDDLSSYHQEVINIPGIGKLQNSPVIYITSSDPAMVAVGARCQIFIPVARG